MSALHYKQEFEPLLPKGFHPLALDGVGALCVEAFPESIRRADIMAGFELIHERFIAVGITGEIWIDGSFLTLKAEPDDIDFVAMVPNNFYDSGTPEQRSFIDWLIDSEDDPKRSFRCHSHVELMYEEDSPYFYLTEPTRNHWSESVFGYSVSGRVPKGIAVVEVVASEQNLPEEAQTAGGIK